MNIIPDDQIPPDVIYRFNPSDMKTIADKERPVTNACQQMGYSEPSQTIKFSGSITGPASVSLEERPQTTRKLFPVKTITGKERPIINACLESAHDLLTDYWGDIARVRDNKDMVVAVTLSFKIDTSGESPVVKTKLGFSRRYNDVSEITVDLGQTEFPFLKAD